MYVVKYKGKFGFIKPISAKRDDEIVTQQFLNQSTVAGIERKLFPELLTKTYKQNRIIRHRISHESIVIITEQVQTRLPNKVKGKRGFYKKDAVICHRHVLVNPSLYLFFNKEEYALQAFEQTVHLLSLIHI